MAREYRVNQQIRAREVLLIDETGEQIGVVPLSDALRRAQDADLDLVEVSPQSNPPVCRLLDYGRFRYTQTKKQRESRKSTHAGLLREVRVRPRIGDHDVEAKIGVVRRLLEEGSKVRVSVMYRGREITHPEIGTNLLRRIAESVKDESKLEKAPSMEGRFLSIVLTPLAKEGGKETRKENEDEEAAG